MKFICRYCKKEFIPKYPSNKNVLCSNDCKYKETSERQRIVALTNNPMKRPDVSKKLLQSRIKNRTLYTGEKNPRWKGGYWINENGYKVIENKRIKKYEHRLVMEDYLGRKLSAIEIVHHINEDKLDNRIENLQIMTKPEHINHHRK